MKLLTFLFLFLGTTLISTAQTLNVPYQKKPLLSKTTATWCIPCGDYQWITDNIYDNHSDSIVFINAHVATSDIGDPYSGDFHNEINSGGGIPAYNVDGTKINAWPPTETDIMTFATAQFDSTIVANIAFTADITPSSITVNTTTKFFENATGEFYVNVFMLENELMTDQNTSSGYTPMVQKRVSRGPIMSGNSGMWGELIESVSASTGDEYNASFTASIPSSWNTDNMEVVAVIWQRTSAGYKVLNSEDKEGNPSTASLNEGELMDNVRIYPNPTSDQITIDGIQTPQTFELMTISGKVVLAGSLSENVHTVTLPDNLAKGIYHLRISGNEKTKVHKIEIQ